MIDGKENVHTKIQSYIMYSIRENVANRHKRTLVIIE